MDKFNTQLKTHIKNLGASTVNLKDLPFKVGDLAVPGGIPSLDCNTQDVGDVITPTRPNQIATKNYVDSNTHGGSGITASVAQSAVNGLFFQLPNTLASNVQILWQSDAASMPTFQPSILVEDDFDLIYGNFEATWRRPAEQFFPVTYTNNFNTVGSQDIYFTNTLGQVDSFRLNDLNDSLEVKLILFSTAQNVTTAFNLYFQVYQLNAGSLQVYMKGSYQVVS